jgi:phospholipid/cholesterol/gamma-HCH transport system substrate-binding protein
MMATRNTEILVGVTVLAALAGVIWSVTALREVRIAESTQRWTARFRDVGGLAEEDPVTVHGVKKGAVKHIRLGNGEVLVEFLLAKDIPVSIDTEVYVRNVGLMGEKFIAIENVGAGALLKARRDTIDGIYESGIPEVISQMGTALISLERLSSSVDRVLTLAEEKNTVRTTLSNMEAGSAEFRRTMVDNRTGLREAIEHLRSAADASRRIAETSEPRVSGALDDVRHATTRVDAMAGRMDSLATVLSRVADKLDSGSGTAGKLVNDQKLYDETQATMKELRALVHDLRTNPRKYFKVSVF